MTNDNQCNCQALAYIQIHIPIFDIHQSLPADQSISTMTALSLVKANRAVEGLGKSTPRQPAHRSALFPASTTPAISRKGTSRVGGVPRPMRRGHAVKHSHCRDRLGKPASMRAGATRGRCRLRLRRSMHVPHCTLFSPHRRMPSKNFSIAITLPHCPPFFHPFRNGRGARVKGGELPRGAASLPARVAALRPTGRAGGSRH